eukprot:sb/3467611/
MPRTPPKESYTLEDFQCKHCHRPFFSKRELTKHIESAHFSEVYKPSSQWCTVCLTTFSSSKELSQHMATYHADQGTPDSTTCSFCLIRFQQSKQLTSHIAQFHIPHSTCVLCRKTFTETRKHWFHMLSEHKIKPSRVDCNLCTASFSDPHEYDSHIKTSHIYPCLLCETNVDSRETLQEHIEQTHKRYYCSDCGEMFEMYESFVRHYITNEGCSLDPYKLICVYCFGSFSNLKLLFRHLCLDSFNCIFCSATCISCKTFQNHLECNHGMRLKYTQLGDEPVASENPEQFQ